MIKGLVRLRSGTVQPGEEKARGYGVRDGLTNVYKCRLGGSEDKDAEHFSVVPVARARGSGHKLKNGKFHLSTNTHFFPGEGV